MRDISITYRVKQIIKEILDERYNELKDHHWYKGKIAEVEKNIC